LNPEDQVLAYEIAIHLHSSKSQRPRTLINRKTFIFNFGVYTSILKILKTEQVSLFIKKRKKNFIHLKMKTYHLKTDKNRYESLVFNHFHLESV